MGDAYAWEEDASLSKCQEVVQRVKKEVDDPEQGSRQRSKSDSIEEKKAISESQTLRKYTSFIKELKKEEQ